MCGGNCRDDISETTLRLRVNKKRDANPGNALYPDVISRSFPALDCANYERMHDLLAPHCPIVCLWLAVKA